VPQIVRADFDRNLSAILLQTETSWKYRPTCSALISTVIFKIFFLNMCLYYAIWPLLFTAYRLVFSGGVVQYLEMRPLLWTRGSTVQRLQQSQCQGRPQGTSPGR